MEEGEGSEMVILSAPDLTAVLGTAGAGDDAEGVPHPPVVRRAPGIDRAEWVRRRASALAGRPRMAEDLDREREERSPWWKRGLRKVFPGL